VTELEKLYERENAGRSWRGLDKQATLTDDQQTRCYPAQAGHVYTEKLQKST